VKRVRIANDLWKIIPDKKIDGATFNFTKNEIRIDPESPSIGDHLLHEVAEIGLTCLHTRYNTYDSQDPTMFIMSHAQFDYFVASLYGDLLGMGVINENKIKQLLGV